MTAKFSCQIGTTDPSVPLGMTIRFNGTEIFNSDHVQHTVDFAHEFPDTDGDHLLEFIMKNKTSEHTQLDAAGEIIQDACLTIKEFALEDINLDYNFTEYTVYEHDFNGAGPAIKDRFFGVMGCNGRVSLAFNSPVYLWLLEHI